MQKIAFVACEVINYSVWNRFQWYLQQAQSMAASLICFIWSDLSCVSWNELIYKATEAINMKQNDIWQSAKNSIFPLWSHQLQCMNPIPVLSAASKQYSSVIHQVKSSTTLPYCKEQQAKKIHNTKEMHNAKLKLKVSKLL